jgi:membrane protease YdiL (CAAX protease family)
VIFNLTTIKNLEKRISIIEKRNKKVELNKAWETSLFRKIIIAVLTYFTIVIFFIFADLPKPFINSIVPTLGFVLSTLSVPFFKKMWIKKKSKKKNLFKKFSSV